MEVFAARLSEKGASVTRSPSLTAKSKGGTVHIEPMGLCWSASDPADLILPAIPSVLECKRERIQLERLKEMYFGLGSSRGETALRFTTRLEGSAPWDALREAGDCGLSPDEHALISAVIEQADTPCTMLTDFPFDGAVVRIHGRRQYYSGLLDSATALATLRRVGSRSERNSYLAKTSTLTFPRDFSLPDGRLASLFDDLGEWCFFTPV
jgi:hypothetical protein